jgi:4-amino-4-deoxy-L-arabinose transferase-like glycosyltransferase
MRLDRLRSGRHSEWTNYPMALGLIAVVWAICFMTLHGYGQPFAEEANIARHIALGHGFRSPMDASPTAPPSAWSSPLYPLVIAAAYRVFGVGSRAAATGLMLLNAVFFAMIVVGTERLTMLLFGSRLPGLIAAGLLACHPLFLFYMSDFWDGYMGLAIFVWLTVAAVMLSSRAGGWTSHTAAEALGVGMGLLALTNASYAVSYPVLLYLAFRQARSRSRRWWLAAEASAVCVLVILPWTIRNYEAFGRLVPIRTASGILFWLGNAPVSDGWLNGKAYALHPAFNPAERRSLLALGEPAYNDLAFQRFESGLIANPIGFLANCLRRSMYLLVGNPAQPMYHRVFFGWRGRAVFWGGLFLNSLIVALGFAGMVTAGRRYAQYELPLLAASVALPFVATAVLYRYTLPLRWFLVMYASTYVWMRFWPRREQLPGCVATLKG